jgi:hypothetical protein
MSEKTIPPHKLIISMLSGEMIWAKTHNCLINAIGQCMRNGVTVAHMNVQTTIISTGRSNAAEAALRCGATHLLFIDSDMVFPPFAPQALLQHDLPVVGCTYCPRRPPFRLLHKELGDVRGAVNPPKPHLAPDETGVREVLRMPTGMLMIRADVLKAMRQPYFRFANIDGKAETVGEDYLFCDDARALGFKIWLDCDLSRSIGHIAQHENYCEDIPELELMNAPAAEAREEQMAVAAGETP